MEYLNRTVLVYLRRNDQYLLLFRNKKENDYNKGKWIGVGGKIEEGESCDQAAIREVKEETGYDVHSLKLAGEVVFINNNYQEIMYVYEISDFTGCLKQCNEGTLKWVPITNIYDYPMWEGDKAFLPLLIEHAPFFRQKIYYQDDQLMKIEHY